MLVANVSMAMDFPATAVAGFPFVSATGNAQNNSNTTTHSVVIPSGIISGDLLLLFSVLDATAGLVLSGHPVGWTSLSQSMDANSNDVLLAIYYKIATGT